MKNTDRIRPNRSRFSIARRVVSAILIAPITIFLLPWDWYYLSAFVAHFPRVSTWSLTKLVHSLYDSSGLLLGTSGVLTLWACILLGVPRLAGKWWTFFVTLAGLLMGVGICLGFVVSFAREFAVAGPGWDYDWTGWCLTIGPFVLSLVNTVALVRERVRPRSAVSRIEEHGIK